MINLVYLLVIFIVYSIICLFMYLHRRKQVIVVDFDSVISDIATIMKRGEIYVKNNPHVDVEDYLYAHINEQIPICGGIKKVWDLQAKFYKIVFTTQRTERLRIPTAKMLNDWGLIGELHMSDSANGDKELLIKSLESRGFIIEGIIDWNNASRVSEYRYL